MLITLRPSEPAVIVVTGVRNGEMSMLRMEYRCYVIKIFEATEILIPSHLIFVTHYSSKSIARSS
jgi:hypothetical protein